MSTWVENKSYREIAKEAGISLGAVNWIMNDLKSLGHLSYLGARGRRLVNRKELLKRWIWINMEIYAEGQNDETERAKYLDLTRCHEQWQDRELSVALSR